MQKNTQGPGDLSTIPSGRSYVYPRHMIDLHTHSTASDGELSPQELAAAAQKAELGVLALTDHDTTSGLKEAADSCRNLGIRFINGVETEVEFSPGEFHLLGLGMPAEKMTPLNTFLETIRERRVERNREIVSLMNADGRELTLEEIERLGGGEVVGRMHFARWLIDNGAARNVPDAFEKWLGPKCAYYVPKVRPALSEAIEAIHASEGKAVLAHPLSLWISWGRLKQRVPEWKEMGLDGLESHHSGASPRQAARFEELAAAHELQITGGSDYHGSSRPDRRLGYGAGNRRLEERFLNIFNHA